MGPLRWLAGVVLLPLSAVGILACVAGVAGAWRFHGAAAERVQTVAGRLHGAVQRGTAANQSVRRAVAKAREDVAGVGKASTGLDGGGEKARRARRTLRSLVQQRIGPDLEDLHGRLATLGDAAVALSSLLQSVQDVAAGRMGDTAGDQVEQWAEEARQLAVALRRLEVVVGDGERQSSQREITAATSEVDAVLQKCQATVEAWHAGLEAAPDALGDTEAKVLGWLKAGAVTVTLLCVWMAAGQVSLFALALRWCKAT
jgi:hypothetical protein